MKRQFVVCIRNEGYAASLEVRKLYELVRDQQAAEHGQLRIVDESGEDYWYPADYFVLIELPEAAEQTFAAAS